MADEIELIPSRMWDPTVADAWEGWPRLRGMVARLFKADSASYDYSHHASLGAFGGRLYAFWSNGRNGEDMPGQVQCWAWRDGLGEWSMPRVLARAPMSPETHPEATTAINGGTAVGAPRLTGYYSEFKGRPQDGAGGTGKWSLPLITGAQTYEPAADAWTHRGIVLEDFLSNEGPRRTSQGRWIMTGEDHEGRTRIAYSDNQDPADDAWRVVGVPSGAGSRYKNEVTWYQRADGTLALFMRDDGGSRRIWLAESRDHGVVWSEPRPTNLVDATSKCYVGQLSHGAYYCIWNPNPTGLRSPLTIALSDDGRTFDRAAILRNGATAPRLPGRFKSAGYQYPNAIQHRGQLHVIYSVNKEDVEVLSVDLADLAELPRLV